MLKKARMLAGLGAVGVSVALIAGSQSAFATTAQGSANTPNADVVGVGSDTLQFAADFLADGSPTSSGYNNGGNKYRMINYDATGDAVGRGLYGPTGGQYYTDSPTTAVVLRAKQKPVEIPDGSSNGIKALLADSPGSGTTYGQAGSTAGVTNGSIQYARMSRIIKATEEGTCEGYTGCGQLHPVAIGTDTLQIAVVATGTHAPSGGFTAAQLKAIYGCTGGSGTGGVWTWADVGGTGTDPIIPVVPQVGAGTRGDFESSIGYVGDTFPSCVKTAQEHDPSGITSQSNPADAIEPFSLARVNLINSNYFLNAGETGGQIALLTSGYSFTRNMYITMREVDVETATKWQPGSTLNWAQTLFIGAASFLNKAAGAADVQAAGFVPGVVDCNAGDIGGGCPSPS